MIAAGVADRDDRLALTALIKEGVADRDDRLALTDRR